MSTLTALQTAQQRLAALYERKRPTLLPDEDRAYLSMLGKLEIMLTFLSIPPDQAAGLPASGEGSMIEAEKMAAAMAADVEDFVVNKSD